MHDNNIYVKKTGNLLVSDIKWGNYKGVNVVLKEFNKMKN